MTFFLTPFICPVSLAHQSQTAPCCAPFTALARSQLWPRPGHPLVFGLENFTFPRATPLLPHLCVTYTARLKTRGTSLRVSAHAKTARLMLPFGLGSAHHSQVTAPLKDKRLLLKANKAPPSAEVSSTRAGCRPCHRQPHLATIADPHLFPLLL